MVMDIKYIENSKVYKMFNIKKVAHCSVGLRTKGNAWEKL